jgi:hypothetical protein
VQFASKSAECTIAIGCILQHSTLKLSQTFIVHNSISFLYFNRKNRHITQSLHFPANYLFIMWSVKPVSRHGQILELQYLIWVHSKEFLLN